MMRNLSSLTFLFLFLLGLAGPAAGVAEPVDVNRATIQQLEAIDGIGSAKARAIVEFRDQNGPFAHVDDLRQVRGIGEKLLTAIRPHVTVGGELPSQPSTSPR